MGRTTPDLEPKSTGYSSRGFNRRTFLAGSSATAALVAVGALEYSAGSRLIIPKNVEASFVNAIEGLEKPLMDQNGRTVGRFFTQTGDQREAGFKVQNDENGRFWSAFQRLGGVDSLGYPLSKPFTQGGYTFQLFQAGPLQVNDREGSPDGVVRANGYDKEMLAGIELAHPNVAAELRARGIPAHREGGFSLPDRLSWLDPNIYQDPQIQQAVTAIREAFMTIGGAKVSLDEAVAVNGAPSSLAENFGLYTAMRFQRNALQLWQLKLPDHPELPEVGSITPFLGGQLLKEFGWVTNTNVLEPEKLTQAESTTTPEADPAVAKILEQTRVVSSVTVQRNGVEYTVETRQHPNTPAKIILQDSLAQEATNLIAEEAEKHGIRNVYPVALPSKELIPAGVEVVTGSRFINGKQVQIFRQGSQRIGDNVFYYFIPIASVDVIAVSNQSITGGIIATVVGNGDEGAGARAINRVEKYGTLITKTPFVVAT